jgi:hypothetical protein
MQLADCCNKMITRYDMQDPIESLFSQIDANVRFTNVGGKPYSDAQYINIAFMLVLVTGVTPLPVLNDSTVCLLNNHRHSSKATSAMLTVSTALSPKRPCVVIRPT